MSEITLPPAILPPVTLYGALLSDETTARLLSDQQQIAYMLYIEGELALAQADAELIPVDAARAIAAVASSLHPAADRLAQATASAGVAVPALVSVLKQALPAEQARWVHYGTTSQDIVDTALILTLRELISCYDSLLVAIIRQLAPLADKHRHTLMAGRTRTQQGAPMSFGLKIGNWLAPLLRQRQRLQQLRPRLLVVQLAGAVGTLSAMQDKGVAVAYQLASRLSLGSGHGWHTQRDTLCEFASWLSLTTGSLGKMAMDWLWLGQSEVAEITFSNGGGSSTMPQKCNPVSAEIIVASARHTAGALATMHQAMLQEHERSGSGWTLEWLTLPAMLMNTSLALRHSNDALTYLLVNTEKMQQNLRLHGGVIYAEALTFALAKHLPRDQAAALVSCACKQALCGDGDLMHLVRQQYAAMAANSSACDGVAAHKTVINEKIVSEIAVETSAINAQINTTAVAEMVTDETQLAQQLLSDSASEHWLNDILAEAQRHM